MATNSSPTNICADKSKEWQMELLMEKLRSKASQFKSFQETSKNVRMTMLDKRYALDKGEKIQHQKCLDTLQNCIKVTSFQSMVERLESLTRQLGLKFSFNPSGYEIFISSDMFYVEVILDPNGTMNGNGTGTGGVRDVKINHEGKNEQQSCMELVYCLSRLDFADFTVQLEGLASIYQLNAEKKVKSKAFCALQALETDLSTLAQMQSQFIKDPFNLLHKSPIGVLEKRRGGHAMRLTYLVSPYELIDPVANRAEPLTVERVISRKLGFSATVCIEGSTAHKLPITPIISANQYINVNNSTPSYAPLTNQNSAVIPAYFTLRLVKPMCVCTVLAKRIQCLTQLDCCDLSAAQPSLLSLITQHASDSQLDCANNRGLFVTLPDQQHCYFLTEGRSLNGVVINNIPFTHPMHIPSILTLLRQQALFNTLISSCVRPNSKQDLVSMIMFEVNVLSWQQLSIAMEHPIDECMATADIDLSDISNISCKIYAPGSGGEASEEMSKLATKVLQRCYSIPVTMRAVIKAWQEVHEHKQFASNENFSLDMETNDPGGSKSPNISTSSAATAINGGSGTVNSNSDSLQNQDTTEKDVEHDVLGDDNFTMMDFPVSANSPPSTSEKQYKKHKRKHESEWKSLKRKSSGMIPTDSGGGGDELCIDSCSSTTSSTNNCDSTPLSIDEKSALDFDDNDLEELLSTAVNSIDSDKKPDEIQIQSTPSVSITPIITASSSASTKLNSMLNEIERRPGIEIIPLPSKVSSSSSSSWSDDKIRKSSKSTTGSKTSSSEKEKKRKRKRDEDGMNPPADKLKQDPLTKPVSVTITPGSPSTKHSSSPSRQKSTSLSSGSNSPSTKHSVPKINSIHKSLSKSSSNSPGGSDIAQSPKHHSASPKHTSSGGSGNTGKPSMSSWKSSSSALSVKSSKSSPNHHISKDRKSSSSSSSPNSSTKLKNSFKVKSTTSTTVTTTTSAIVTPVQAPEIGELNTASSPTALQQNRNRKGSLSAIVDNLHKKSAQTSTTPGATGSESMPSTTASGNGGNIDKSKSSEYMVKHSSDGMKITINKTRTKESKPLTPTSNSNSPKTHTGLKPGVNSGPASKKPQQLLSQKSSSPSLSKSSSSSPKPLNKLNLTAFSSKSKPNTSSSSSLSSNNKFRNNFNKIRSSPTLSRSGITDDLDGIISERKLTKNEMFASHLMVEGLIKQQLDTKFQIPKLSSKIAAAQSSSTTTSSTSTTTITTTSSITIDDNKKRYQDNTVNSLDDDKICPDKLIVPTTTVNLMHLTKPTQPCIQDNDTDVETIVPNTDDKFPVPFAMPTTDTSSPQLAAPAPSPQPLSANTSNKHTTELAMKVTTATTDLLDFTSVASSAATTSLPGGTSHSPSVSVHIMKSPAPSPMMIIPSPHSVVAATQSASSPACITDDDLMDEALVGIGK